MKKILFSLFACLSFQANAQVDLARHVDPFIGTGGHGHTYPGATLPFGMVQLSPDTRVDGSWDGCGGYHHSDSMMYGFSHTHLSGTGCSDYGDILLLPYVNKLDGTPIQPVRFSHTDELAEPGYYSVDLPTVGVKTEFTTTARVGFHRYAFNGVGEHRVLLDLRHRDKVLGAEMRMVSNRRIEGYRRSSAWARDQVVYFSMEFSRPFELIDLPGNETAPDSLHYTLRFKEDKSNELLVKVALSSVSEANARMNLERELPGWDFVATKSAARAAWNRELGKIEAKGGSEKQLRIFYTALYHTMIVPNVYSDVDGRYRGRDGQVHAIDGPEQYTVFSLWDTYRAWHPLMTIIDRKRTTAYVNTFLRQYREGGLLPVWELSANETECMIGYHAVPVIADADAKGIGGFDRMQALMAMRKSAEAKERYGLGAYMKHAMLSLDDEHESVSKTLEYAYDDWCIATMAQRLGQGPLAQQYFERSQSWKNLLNPVTGFMQPRVNGGWLSPFDPYEVNNNFTEANSWQYSFYVPQDIPGLMRIHGGMERFAARLDSLFAADNRTRGREQADITGLIGQYAHGNEPSHHMAYLYNYCGQPWKTQRLVRKIMDEFYQASPDGLIGNEDCGQMSAWLVFSAMGFYPVTPGAPYYAIGTPWFQEVTIHLEDGKSFVVRADEPSASRCYIQSLEVNGQVRNTAFLSHEELSKGGSMSFTLSDRPASNWGTGTWSHPEVAVDSSIVINPVIHTNGKLLRDSMTISISAAAGDTILYSVDGVDLEKKWSGPGPTRSGLRTYTGPFTVKEATTVQSMAVRGNRFSRVVRAEVQPYPHPDWKVAVATEVNPQYTAGGPEGIIDGIRGTTNWRKGDWQGYQGADFEAVIDFGKPMPVRELGGGFLQDMRSWILMPKSVEFQLSDDGKTYKTVLTVTNSLSDRLEENVLHDFEGHIPVTVARYLKVKAVNYGRLPIWHPGAGYPAFIFVDEVWANP